jgi:1-acyl-sn-glycerol-3-phosphate acyltransferase
MLLSLFLMGWAVSRLRFEENIMSLLPTSEEGEQTAKILENVQFADKTVVLLESLNHDGDPSSMKAYAEELENYLGLHAEAYIDQLQLRADEESVNALITLIRKHLPLYLDASDYALLQEKTGKEALLQNVREAWNEAQWSGGANLNTYRTDPFGLTWMALRKFEQLQTGAHFHLEDGFLMDKDQQHLIGFLNPRAPASETSNNQILINKLRKGIDSLDQVYEGEVKGAFFGATPMAVANAHQIKQDIQLTLGIAIILLIALFYYFYRKLFVPLIAFIPAVFGSLLGLTVLYLIKGTISAISIGIGSVLLGLTLDYSLHILSHYRSTGDINALFKSITRPLLMCAVFTAVDFLCLLFLRSAVLQDLGVFAAISVSGSAFFALWIIPQVYTPHQDLMGKSNTLIDRVAKWPMEKLPWVVPGIVLLLISLFTAKHVGFNHDLQSMQFKPKDLAKTEHKLENLQQDSAKSIYLISHAAAVDSALHFNQILYQKITQLQKQNPHWRIQSIAPLVPSFAHQQQKIDQWKRFWTEQKKKEVKDNLKEAGTQVGFKTNTFAPFFAWLDEEFETVHLHEEEAFQNLFLQEYLTVNPNMVTIMTTLKVPKEEAAALLTHFTQEPHVIALDRKQVQEQLLSNLEQDFDQLVWMTSIAIFVVILLFFGSLELTLITNIPIFAGWLITLGLMGIAGIDFNAFNIIIATLIFGLGVDYAIFMTRGLLARYTYGHQELPIYKGGILISALATLLCFGILILAKHPAIQSIAAIPLIGLLVVVYMSFTIQPALFRFYIERSQEIGNAPRTIPQIIWTIFTFGYFFLGSLFLSIIARAILLFVPISPKKTAPWLHRLMHKFFSSLMWRTPGCPITILDKTDDLFEKPVILIANHTSQLDTPTLGMLHERLIFMVNDRVLNSKFFGKAIQSLGFYSADTHYEESLPALAKKIKQGYSIVIFPEGTRSRTAEIGRFHKGAFFLSQQLQIDIVPVLVHGNTDVLPKNDNVLKPGPLTIQFLPKIRHDDQSWGIHYRERTKNILAYFRASFVSLRQRMEDSTYFAEKERACFRYKPRAIREASQQDFAKNHERYHWLCRQLPRQGKIIHYGCHYGFLSRLLVYDSSQRQVLAWDKDAEKRAVAQQSFATKRYPVQFLEEKPDVQGAAILVLGPEATLEKPTASYAQVPLLVCIDPTPDTLQHLQKDDRKILAQQQGIYIFGFHDK